MKDTPIDRITFQPIAQILTGAIKTISEMQGKPLTDEAISKYVDMCYKEWLEVKDLSKEDMLKELERRRQEMIKQLASKT